MHSSRKYKHSFDLRSPRALLTSSIYAIKRGVPAYFLQPYLCQQSSCIVWAFRPLYSTECTRSSIGLHASSATRDALRYTRDRFTLDAPHILSKLLRIFDTSQSFTSDASHTSPSPCIISVEVTMWGLHVKESAVIQRYDSGGQCGGGLESSILSRLARATSCRSSNGKQRISIRCFHRWTSSTPPTVFASTNTTLLNPRSTLLTDLSSSSHAEKATEYLRPRVRNCKTNVIVQMCP